MLRIGIDLYLFFTTYLYPIMAEKKTVPIRFNCFNSNCNKENTFSIDLPVEGNARGGRTIVQKCLFCGTDNSIDMPDIHKLLPTVAVLRGGKVEK